MEFFEKLLKYKPVIIYYQYNDVDALLTTYFIAKYLENNFESKLQLRGVDESRIDSSFKFNQLRPNKKVIEDIIFVNVLPDYNLFEDYMITNFTNTLVIKPSQFKHYELEPHIQVNFNNRFEVIESEKSISRLMANLLGLELTPLQQEFLERLDLIYTNGPLRKEGMSFTQAIFKDIYHTNLSNTALFNCGKIFTELDRGRIGRLLRDAYIIFEYFRATNNITKRNIIFETFDNGIKVSHRHLTDTFDFIDNIDTATASIYYTNFTNVDSIKKTSSIVVTYNKDLTEFLLDYAYKIVHNKIYIISSDLNHLLEIIKSFNPIKDV